MSAIRIDVLEVGDHVRVRDAEDEGVLIHVCDTRTPRWPRTNRAARTTIYCEDIVTYDADTVEKVEEPVTCLQCLVLVADR